MPVLSGRGKGKAVTTRVKEAVARRKNSVAKGTITKSTQNSVANRGRGRPRGRRPSTRVPDPDEHDGEDSEYEDAECGEPLYEPSVEEADGDDEDTNEGFSPVASRKNNKVAAKPAKKMV